MSNVTNKLHEQSSHQISNSEIENWALTAVSVVERFITERNALRERVRAQDRELSLLRHHISLMRSSYRRLSNDLATQLKTIDNLFAETRPLYEPQEPTENRQLDPSKIRVA